MRCNPLYGARETQPDTARRGISVRPDRRYVRLSARGTKRPPTERSCHELAACTGERYMQEFGYTGGKTRPLSQRSASSHKGSEEGEARSFMEQHHRYQRDRDR
ncbi:hypothetical protein [Methanoculleus sp.]|uniref:hypothetical protein n=1 Tax=Methanoculleus sp. TaxID=90427 RepID=UPI00262A40EB|nr:hypothetical protein [Methanoculleus sp.]MDI6866666.1 hypothetical protein [Methanoculleus sp.]